MERFTICGLRSFVDYVNETVPKIEGKHFEIQSTNGCHFIILKGTEVKTAQQHKIRT